MASQYTMEYLKELQGYPLEIKIQLTKQRIREWVHKYGEDGVYVSFSGGKDSTVLLHLVREMYGDVIPGVFVDTGFEYPEIREFVRTFDNIVWLRPEMNFRKVIETYGYPMISKEVSQQVWEVQKYGKDRAKRTYSKFVHDSEYNRKYGGQYSMERYAFLLDEGAPRLSHMCCKVMKKNPSQKYEKQTSRLPITGEMACESRLRKSQWLKNGCNAFDAKKKVSKPLSFWTEQDVLRYIREYDIEFASVYGDVVIDDNDQLEGQMDISDYGLSDENLVFKTTGCSRTGCMFCGFGCRHSDWSIRTIKETHPKIYDYIMRPWEQGGLNYKEVIDWINEHGDLHIRY